MGQLLRDGILESTHLSRRDPIHYGLNTIRLLCIFHKERTPSLKIYVKTRSFCCYGCGKHGWIDDPEHEELKKLLDEADRYNPNQTKWDWA